MGVIGALERRWKDFGTVTALRWCAIASIVANVVIVVTGGAVRLSDSGLGCPTWPTCEGGSLTPTARSTYHTAIEFTNRSLTGVLIVVASLTLLSAWRQRRQVPLALLAFAVIPVQAVIGGISVLTHLNPWVVAVHLLTSMANIAVTVVLWWRVRAAARPPVLPRAATLLARLVTVAAAAVLAAGTVVTGSGPHSGAKQASQRIAVKPASVTQLHADLVMVLIGLSIGLLAVLYAVHAHRAQLRAVQLLVGLEFAQGVVGYVQYFTHLPAVLVGVHVFGACLVWIAAVYTLLMVRAARPAPPRASEQPADAVDHHTHERTDDGAVQPDELQVSSDL
jgi:cytochrome c oxidase assembly protein subunit 15